MLRTLVIIIALLLTTGGYAGYRPHIRYNLAYRPPTATSSIERREVEATPDPVHAAAKAQQEAFDRKIAGSSDRAVRSICSHCGATPSSAASTSRQQARGSLNADGLMIADPGLAPVE